MKRNLRDNLNKEFNVVLIKENENLVSIRDTKLETNTFVSNMGELGFDTFFTKRTLNMMNTGGEWFMNLNEEQLRFLCKTTTPSKGGGKGFLN